jgi:pilus assembly protein CpaE
MPPMPGGSMPAYQPQAQPVGAHPPMGMGMPMAAEPESEREGGEKALPQISIHAFCDRQETASVINGMTRDWRMKRTNVKIYMGGLSAAIEYYHKESTPGLILVETGMRGPELFAQLGQLASVCDEGTKVVIIGAANDIRLYRQLMDKGVSDYIVPPLLALNLIRSIGDLYSDPEAPFIGRVAAFFGAKGGVGSSTLAHNIAWCLSEGLGQETSLVDLDSSFGTTGLDFAYDATQGLEEALAEPDRLDETLLDRIMIRHTSKLSILPASSSLNTKPILDEHAYEAVVNGVRSISPLTLLDMPHYWADWTTNILTSVDDVVITATPDLANLRNTKNLVDFLRAERPNDSDPILILNKTGMTKGSEIPVKEFAAAVGLEPSLVLSFDPESFFEAANEGKMLDQVRSAERTVSGLTYLASRLKTGRFDETLHADASGKRKLSKKAKAPAAGKQPAEKSSLFSFLKKGK